jgi:peptidyl-prolyl cis-trans isomerase D
VVIDKEKYSIQEFGNFINKFASDNQKINDEQIEELLSVFIGNKLIEKEIKRFEIKLSDNSLSKLIKHQKDFKRENKFSRTEYEKFLLKNNLTAVSFEAELTKHEKKNQFMDLIGGGILPSRFLVNSSYNKVNQKRNVQIINLNDLFKNEFNFSENEIKSYYENNKDDYKEIYKHAKILELNPKKLMGIDEFNDTYYNKIGEIEFIDAH